ncbi:KR domain-containing protein, partial [Mycena rosella]
SLPAPLAGCFHMTMVLSDALFLDQTPDTFRTVYDSKIRVFEVFYGAVEIQRLDFVVVISSFSGLVGVPGQSNYASACNALDGALSRHPNAFSLIAPGIWMRGIWLVCANMHP